MSHPARTVCRGLGPVSALGALLLMCLGACGSASDPQGAGPADGPLTTAVSAGGTWQVSVTTSPQPPVKGLIEVTYQITDATGAPADGLTLQVVPWMAAHGHGTSAQPTVTAEGGGSYLIQDVYLYMSGSWELQTAMQGDVSDSVDPVVDVP